MYSDRSRALNPEGDPRNKPTSRSDSPQRSRSETPEERGKRFSPFQPLPPLSHSEAGPSTRPQTLKRKEAGSDPDEGPPRKERKLESQSKALNVLELFAGVVADQEKLPSTSNAGRDRSPAADSLQRHDNSSLPLTVVDTTNFEKILSGTSHATAKNASGALQKLTHKIQKHGFTIKEEYASNVSKSAKTLNNFLYVREHRTKHRKPIYDSEATEAINTIINEIHVIQEVLNEPSAPLEKLFVALTKNIPASIQQSLRDKGKARAIEHRSSLVEEIDEIILNKINGLDHEKINSLYSSAQAGARRNSKYQSLYEHAALFRGYINCKSKNKDVVVGGVYYTQGELEINACKSYQKLEIFYHETNDNDIKQIIKEAGFDFAQQT